MGRPASCDCGLCPKCRQREYMRRWYAANPSKLAEQRERARQKWRDDPEAMRARDRRRTRGKQKRNETKAAANRAVYRALAEGELEREPCLFCDADHVEAHHHDYTLPLAVTWLCRRHHRLAHRRYL